MKKQILAGCLILTSITSAYAQQFKAGDITIEQPWSRETPKGAPVAGGYLVVHNNGKMADRLTAATIDQADHVEVHEMAMDGNIMKMRQLTGGLEIPAGGTVTLKPNSFHLMLMGLKKQLVKGDVLHGTITFEHAGPVQVDFQVAGMGDPAPEPGKGSGTDTKPMGHGTMQMSH